MRKEPKEKIVVEKVFDMINYLFPHELEKARKKYKGAQENKWFKTQEESIRGFTKWFLLNYRIDKGATPMEVAYSCPLPYFTKQEKQILESFMKFTESLFKVKSISPNKKDYIVSDQVDGKDYLVKTIDLNKGFSVRDFLFATLVKSYDKGYFFYGNIAAYSNKEGEKIRKAMQEGMRRLKVPRKKFYPEIEWEIGYKK